MMKTDKGIALVSLLVTVAVMIIIASITINVNIEKDDINNMEKMKSDLKLLEAKVSNYYLKYNTIPVVRDADNNIVKYVYTSLEFNKNIKDNDNYYIIDLKAMANITLNYGREGFENINASNDVYIINEESHQIYYVAGIIVDEISYHSIIDSNNIEDNIPPSKPEIKIISGKKDKEGIYLSEVQLEIIPGKDNWSGINKTTYSYTFTDINNNTTTVTEEIIESKTITLLDSGEYNFVVTSVDNNNNTSSTDKTIQTNIQYHTILSLSDVVTHENYGDLIEYEANGIKDWKIFFNDGENVFIITSDFVPYTSLPVNSKMIRNGKYNIFWEPIYGSPEPGFEYGHAPIVADITENSKILERAERFNSIWIQENFDKDWNSTRAVKDLLNDDVWNVFAEGLKGAEAIGAPTLEMFAESWEQKGCKELKYSRGENGYSIGDNGSWFSLVNASNDLDISLYLPLKQDPEGNGAAYWVAAISPNDTHSLLVVDGNNGGIFGDWYNAQYYGIRVVVCLPQDAIATLEDGVWTELTVY